MPTGLRGWVRDAAGRLSALSEARFRAACLVLAGALLGAWVGVFLTRPGLFPEGAWEGNARWRESVPRGIRLVGDTPRYLLGAERVLAGLPLHEKQGSYRGYIVLAAFCLRTGLGIAGLAALQIALGFLTLPLVYSLGHTLGGRWAGAAAVLLYSANPEPAVWHTAIQTDSVYFSWLIVVVWLQVKALGSGGLRWAAASLAAMAVVVFLRPNGWIVPPALGIHAILSVRGWPLRRRAAAAAALAGVCLAAAFAVRSLRSGIEAEGPVQRLYAGEVLWGYAPWRLRMPPAEGGAEDWGAAVRYVARHPAACLRLAAARVGSLFARVRPMYSLRHNLFLLAVYPALYGLALAGAARHWRSPAGGALLAVIAGHVLTVALTFDHVDGRFFLYVLPEMLVFSACGLRALAARPARAAV